MLVAGLLAAVFWRNLPTPLPAASPAEDFSAERAQTVIAEIARAPHPVGSAENQRVRTFLFEQLRSIGFAPVLQTGSANGILLTNVFLRIEGSASTGTLVCLAHLDSVSQGPGASDDSIGVACWLESFRALKARGWQPRSSRLWASYQ